MSTRPLAFLLLALAAFPASAQRVEVAPEVMPEGSAPTVTVVPLNPLPVALSPTPLAAGMAVIPAAAPLPLAASPMAAPFPQAAAAPLPPAASLAPAAMITADALPAAFIEGKTEAAVLTSPGARTNIGSARRDGSRPTLLQSVSAAMPDLSRLSGGESAAAAEKDFNARAQLGATDDGAAVFAAASTPEPGPRSLRGLQRAARPAAAPPAARGLEASGDADGGRTRAALTALSALPAGETLTLDFTPTPKSLEVLASADGALLVRSRGDGLWRLTKAGSAGFDAAADDFDAAFLGRTSGAGPAPADLRASRGRAARFVLVGPRGATEWNSDMPDGAADALDSSPRGRLLTRASAAVGLYSRLLSFQGVAAETRSWAKVAPDWIEEGRAPVGERQMADTIIPGWMQEELPVAAGKLGRAHPPEYLAGVLARSKVWVYQWHSYVTYEISNGLPDGHFDPKFGTRVMLKTDWRKLKDPENHFRVLFAHEYTHWLQNEGFVSRKYGAEIAAVAVETLRAEELVGLDGMKEGRIGFIHEGTIESFEDGRKWARGSMNEEGNLYFRGFLGGAAYEVGRIAGRPEAAWEFLNLVIAENGALTPREAFERVTGQKK